MDASILELIEKEACLLHKSNEFASMSLPSRHKLQELMDLIWETIFYTDFHPYHHEVDELRLGLLSIFTQLTLQIDIIIGSKKIDNVDSRSKAKGFISQMHSIKELMLTDVDAILRKDPAAPCALEVIASYPAIKAILYYRIAHCLYELDIPVLPRMITELAHSVTGIDIHPGATIGKYFAIDHGTGIVIGETCIIGDHVTLYQGVTLGAKAFTFDDYGEPMAVERHPILEDNVTVYSNASVLGRITVGHDSVVGGNVWLTHSIPPYSKVTQGSSITRPTILHQQETISEN